MASNRKRYNPPSEDFAETKQKLKDALQKIEALEITHKRLRHTITQLDDMIADILDDTGKTCHES